jgi:MFS family permease
VAFVYGNSMRVTLDPTGKAATASTAVRMLAVLAAAEFLGMTAWFSATAATPALIAEFQLDAGGASWVTMAVQAGFVAGTLVSAVANLPDVLNPRRLFAIGCLVAAAANAMVTRAGDPATAIAMRLLTGAALACVYPPGMKIAASWFVERRGLALGVLVGALTAGKAFPHLLQALIGDAGWRTPMLIASLLTLVAGALVLSVVRDGPHVPATSRFDPHAALRLFTTPGARQATFGYLGHMWELYAMWTWVAAFATASLAASGSADPARGGSGVAFVAIVSGTIGCVLAGWLGDRAGKARVAAGAMVVSGLCCAATPFAYGAPAALLIALVSIWGFAVVADSAQFSALVAEHSEKDHVGTALTVQTCLGFLLTIVTIRLTPAVAASIGWQWAFLLLIPGPIAGVVALRPLLGPAVSRISS